MRKTVIIQGIFLYIYDSLQTLTNKCKLLFVAHIREFLAIIPQDSKI